MKVEITGISDIERMNKILLEPNNFIIPIELSVEECAELIRRYAPERTGELVNNIYIIKKLNSFEIVISVPHALPMEYGTKFFPVGTVDSPRARTSTSGKPCFHPFIRLGVWETMEEFPESIKKALFKKLR